MYVHVLVHNSRDPVADAIVGRTKSESVNQGRIFGVETAGWIG